MKTGHKELSHSDFTKETTSRLRVNRQRVGIIALGATMVISASLGLKGQAGEQEKQQEAATNNVHEAASSYILLEPGANVRTSPTRVEDTSSGDTNIAFQVPSGKRVLVKLPVISPTAEGWVGFDNPQTKTHNSPTDTVWVNLDQLVADGHAEVVSQGKDDTLPVSISESGQFLSDFDHTPVGQSEMGPAEHFDSEYNYMTAAQK